MTRSARKRRTLEERARESMPLVWRGSIARGSWQPAVDEDSYVKGFKAGHKNEVKDGRKQGEKAALTPIGYRAAKRKQVAK